MLVQVKQLLIKYHYLHKDEICYTSARLLGNWGFLISTSLGKFFHIKVDTQDSLSQEYAQLRKLYEKHPEFMAEPKGYYEWAGQGYLINQALEHQPLSPQSFIQNSALQDNMAKYLSCSLLESYSQEAHNLNMVISGLIIWVYTRISL